MSFSKKLTSFFQRQKDSDDDDLAIAGPSGSGRSLSVDVEDENQPEENSAANVTLVNVKSAKVSSADIETTRVSSEDAESTRLSSVHGESSKVQDVENLTLVDVESTGASSVVVRKAEESQDVHGVTDESEGSDDEDSHTIHSYDHQLEVKQVTLSWYHLNVTSKVKKSKWAVCCPRTGPPPVFKQMLINVNGEIRPGELLAVMGSSGAGKTTLMNAITGRNLNRIEVSGAVLMNGKKITSTMKKLVSYVEQDDIFIGGLTVREHLIFQAQLRMKKRIPLKTKVARVDQVMAELRLTKCSYTVIGIPGRVKGASGGEKKRLAFASELLTNPSVMFCDEPTSGLDSFMAENVVCVLKELADVGRTILCTIHQPSSAVYALFNNILFLAHGRVAFMGTSEETMTFFESVGLECPRNYNPADYYIGKLSIIEGSEEASRNNITEICRAYEQSNYARRFSQSHVKIEQSVHDIGDRVTEKSRKKNPWYYQCWVLYRRSVLSLSREPLLTTVRLAQSSLISSIVAILFWQQKMDQEGTMNMNGAVFIMLTNMTVQNGFAVMTTFCEEIPVFLREYSSGIYRISTYFVGKSTAESWYFCVCDSNLKLVY